MQCRLALGASDIILSYVQTDVLHGFKHRVPGNTARALPVSGPSVLR